MVEIRTVALSAALCVGLAACEPPKTAEPHASEKLSGGEVVQIALAPDGTVLWKVRDGSREVYFASSGAQWQSSCGKGCSRTNTVPSVEYTP